MHFDLSDDQRDIQRTAREMLSTRSSFERVREAAEARRYDESLWGEIRELGWPGTAIDEAYGGQGLGMVELAVLLEELGYAVAVTPHLGSALAGLLIQSAGSDEQRERWLPGLADGSQRGALGTLSGDGGTAELVPDAPGADLVVLVDPAAGKAAVQDCRPTPPEDVASIDPTRRYGRVSPAEGEALEGDVYDGLGRVLVAVSAELLGISQRALDLTLKYVKERKQFGVPVGSFQAVQHRAAQMLLDTEGGRGAVYYAAWAAGGAPERLKEAAAMAKAWTSQAAKATTAAAIQLHGGIGFTWEANLHWLFKRAQLDSAFLGGPALHYARLAHLVARQPTPA
jgi:alkylation response protein AidB-like acyl-CoA dehydrogenase